MKTKILLFGATAILLSVSSCKKEEDKSAPVVTMLGKETDRVLAPKTYTDPGATATDDVDGDLTSKIVAHNSIDYNNPNVTYDIYYTATDAAGNEGSSGQRLVMLINLAMQFETTTVANGVTTTTWDTPDFVVADSLKFKKFATYADGYVNAYMPNDSTLIIPAQTVTCGDSFQGQMPRTFSGTGTLSYVRSGPSVRTTIAINYTQVENGVTTNGTTTYKN